MEENKVPEKWYEYRGIKVPIYLDEAGQCFYTVLDGEEFGFGSFNTEFDSDIRYLIDRKLDLIFEFKDFKGAKLEWFENGLYRDIRLVYRSRAVKIFLVNNENEITEISIEHIIKESLNILERLKNILR